MKTYFYKYVDIHAVHIDIRYLIYTAFHELKRKLGVVYRFNTNEIIPVYFFSTVENESNADFSSDCLWFGYHRRDTQSIGVNPFRPVPDLLNTIAHETKHVRQFRDCVDGLVKKGFSPDEIQNEVFVKTQGGLEGARPVDVKDYEVDFEKEAREFGAKYGSWKTACKYFMKSEQYQKKHAGLLFEYDFKTASAVKGK